MTSKDQKEFQFQAQTTYQKMHLTKENVPMYFVL